MTPEELNKLVEFGKSLIGEPLKPIKKTCISCKHMKGYYPISDAIPTKYFPLCRLLRNDIDCTFDNYKYWEKL